MTQQTTQASSTSKIMPGRWLLLGQMVWVLTALFAVGVFFTGLPAASAVLRTICTSDRCVFGHLAPGTIQWLTTLGVSLDDYAAMYVGFNVATTLVWWALSGVIVWRRSNDWMALLVALMLLLQGSNFVAGVLQPQYLLAVWLDFLSWSLLAVVFYLFPDGRFVPRWMRWFALLTVALNVWYYFLPQFTVTWLSNEPGGKGWFVQICSLVFAQVYRYCYVSSPVQRQQTKWVVFGFTVFYTSVAFLALPVALMFSTPLFDAWYPLVIAVAVPMLRLLIPISIGFATLHSRLYDIDIIINRTLVYVSLTVLLAAIYVGSVILLQRLLASLIGSNDQIAIVASTLMIAALFQSLRRRIQSIIDQRFYRRKYDAQKTLQAFSARLREETDLTHLSDDLIAVVQDTMQPSQVSLWLRERKN